MNINIYRSRKHGICDVRWRFKYLGSYIMNPVFLDKLYPSNGIENSVYRANYVISKYVHGFETIKWWWDILCCWYDNHFEFSGIWEWLLEKIQNHYHINHPPYLIIIYFIFKSIDIFENSSKSNELWCRIMRYGVNISMHNVSHI